MVNADVLRRYNSIVGATVLEDTLAAGVVQPRILFPTLTQPCPHPQGKLFAYPLTRDSLSDLRACPAC